MSVFICFSCVTLGDGFSRGSNCCGIVGPSWCERTVIRSLDDQRQSLSVFYDNFCSYQQKSNNMVLIKKNCFTKKIKGLEQTRINRGWDRLVARIEDCGSSDTGAIPVPDLVIENVIEKLIA